MTIILPGVRGHATEEGPPDSSGDAVINADLVFHEIWPRAYEASARLLKQRRAFTTQIMSTTTVRDKSTKLSCRVKHPTEKEKRSFLSAPV